MDKLDLVKLILCLVVIGKISFKKIYKPKNKILILTLYKMIKILPELYQDQYIMSLRITKTTHQISKYIALFCKFTIKKSMICFKFFIYNLGFIKSQSFSDPLI